MRRALCVLLLASAAGADTSRRRPAFDANHCGLIRTVFPNVGRVYGVAFSPDGALLVAAGEAGRFRILRTADGSAVANVRAHGAGIWSAAFSPDGRLLATGGLDNQVKIWSARGEELATLAGHSSAVYGIAWSPDGKRLATTSADQSVRIWDAASGRGLRTLQGHTAYSFAVAWKEDGTRLYTGGYDGTVRVWDAAKGDLLVTLATGDSAVASIAVSRDGKRVYTGGDNAVREWEVASKRLARTVVTGGGGLVQGLALTGDERHLLVASGSSLQVWETARLTKVSVLQHHTQNINALAVHGGGRWIATAGLDCQVKFWGYRSGGMTHVRPKGFFGIRVQDSPDGDGVLVTDVIANTAAERAGIRSGDLIRAVGGERVTNSNESIAMISSFFADDEVEFTILREGAERKVRAKLGKRPENLEK